MLTSVDADTQSRLLGLVTHKTQHAQILSLILILSMIQILSMSSILILSLVLTSDIFLFYLFSDKNRQLPKAHLRAPTIKRDATTQVRPRDKAASPNTQTRAVRNNVRKRSLQENTDKSLFTLYICVCLQNARIF